MNAKVLFSFLVVFAMAIAYATAYPGDVTERAVLGYLEEPAHEEPVHERHRRVTCDLLSVSTPIGSFNHAACAAHCLSMGGGRRGGSCQNGVCVCRR